MRIGMIAYTELRYDGRVKRAALAALEANFEVEIFTIQERVPIEIPGIKIISSRRGQYFGNNKIYFVLNYLRFLWFLSYNITIRHFRKRYGIIHVHNMPNFLVFSCLIPKLTGTKIILDIHDLVPEVYAAKFRRSLDNWLIKLLYWEERISARFSDVVISTNKLHNTRFSQNKLNKASYPIILNASDEAIFTPGVSHNFYEKKLRMIFPSTIAKRLGLDILIDAFTIVAENVDDIELHIFGDGEYKEELTEIISKRNISDKVILSGFIDQAQLSKEYDRSHIGVVPWPSNQSTNYQMPVKINEYFLKGIAAIVSDVEILKEYFSDYAVFFEAGNSRDFADKILMLCSDRVRLEYWGKKGHEFYLKNRWPKYKLRYQEIIKQLVNIESS